MAKTINALKTMLLNLCRSKNIKDTANRGLHNSYTNYFKIRGNALTVHLGPQLLQLTPTNLNFARVKKEFLKRIKNRKRVHVEEKQTCHQLVSTISQ